MLQKLHTSLPFTSHWLAVSRVGRPRSKRSWEMQSLSGCLETQLKPPLLIRRLKKKFQACVRRLCIFSLLGAEFCIVH